jgi:hypothetical protein
MTRKDYALIAQTFADAMNAYESKPETDSEFMRDWLANHRNATKMLAETLAQRIAYQNPNFNATKFLNACQTD